MHESAMETINEAQSEGITNTQDKVLSILPIPSALLSIFGSSVILYMAISTRRQRQWTTYTRLLIGLSVCDIISSVSLAFSPFMRRPESGRAWAVGNDATCTAIGTMTQLSYSNIFFNAMLSYYFLATVRFQMKHSRIAKFVEPWMHFISIGYPLVTSVLGAALGMYGEKATGMGCWVNEYPRGCGDEEEQEPCTSGTIGWFYLGLPLLFSGFSILINNLIIACYVWAHTRTSTHSRRAPRDALSTSTSSDFTSKMEQVTQKQEQTLNEHQLRRLRLVSSQAFLFVASYAICTLSLGTLGIAEAMTKEENEKQLMKNLYWLMVLNAILAPLQGFLNMLVYIRPKYLKNRQEFCLETKFWAVRRAIFGERVRAHRFIYVEEKGEENKRPVKPSKADAGSPADTDGQMKDIERSERSLSSVPKPNAPMVSSVTLSNWDQFDQDSINPDDLLKRSERWVEGVVGDVSNAAPTSRHQSQPQINFHSSISSLGFSLPLIHENVVTELMDIDDSSHSSDDVDDIIVQKPSSETRWGSTTADIGKASQILSTSNHTKSSEARWSSTKTDIGKSSQNLDGFSKHQLSTSNHTKTSRASSARLVAPTRRASVEHNNDGMATATMWAASLGFKIPASKPSDSPLVAPARLASDCEMVDDTGDTKIVVKRSSLVAPKRHPSDHKMARVQSDIKPAPKSPNLAPVAPRRVPTEFGSSGELPLIETTQKPSAKPTAAAEALAKTANLPPVAPRRVPTEFGSSGELPLIETTQKTTVKPTAPAKLESRSPNLAPVAPRRVPTEFGSSGELPLIETKPPLAQRSISIEIPQRLPSGQSVPRARNLEFGSSGELPLIETTQKPSAKPTAAAEALAKTANLPPVAPRRVPTEFGSSGELPLIETTQKTTVKSTAPAKLESRSPNLAPVAPRRVPTEFGSSGELPLIETKPPVAQRSISIEIPKRLPSGQSVPRARNLEKKSDHSSQANRSPMLAPAVPRRVPTEVDDSDEFMLG